jgi:CRP/FNR family transcriptional regulator, dissimilatory nitrate respiration regulator
VDEASCLVAVAHRCPEATLSGSCDLAPRLHHPFTMPIAPADREMLRRAAIAATLRRCRLFADLPEDDVAAVAGVCTLRGLAKGEFLFREGQPADGFYVVQSGVINVHRIGADGREQVICLFRATESFAETTLVTFDTYPASAAAAEPSQVLLVHKAGFRDLVAHKPELALSMLGSMSQHLKHFVQLLQDFRGRQFEARLADWIVHHCPAAAAGCPAVLELPVTKKILAAQLGATSETLSRTFARFRDEGTIAVDGRRITVRDAARLQAWADGTG